MTKYILFVKRAVVLNALLWTFFVFPDGIYAEGSFNKKEQRAKKKKMDLGQLFRHYGSDKDKHGYTSVYHTLFTRMKNKKIALLEIGIGTMIPNAPSSMMACALAGYKPGGSLRAFRDYFKKGSIYGVDIQPDTQFSDEPHISTYICDSTDEQSVRNFMKKIGNIKFDIIIDDGSHLDVHQLKTLSNFYPYVKKGGLYIIEDIVPSNSILASPEKLSKICHEDPLFFVGLRNELVIIYKNHLERSGVAYAF